ncbi:MAG: DEAD/DEAH box helicase [Planctomycetaceae bacterium]
MLKRLHRRLSSPRLRSTGSVNSSDQLTLLPHVRTLAESLETSPGSVLLAEAAQLRRELSRGRRVNDSELLVSGVALACEALRRAHGITLYDVQLQAVLSLGSGTIVQMQTGEGKTFVAVTVACHLALAGQGVHVITPNTYLATRDCEAATPVLEQLQMTTGLLPEGGENDARAAAYGCDVTYGTGHEFGFDYLRDQLTLRQQANAPLGAQLFDDLCRPRQAQRSTMQRGLSFAVVDEADSVLIDDAGSPLVLSAAAPGPAPDERAHLTARDLADTLEDSVDYEFDRPAARITLTRAGTNRCYADDVAVPAKCLLRPWTDYVEQALRALVIFQRNIHYVIVEDEVRIVDATTGRIFEDRSWQQGLHQAVEAREGVPVTAEKQALARISRQRFFRLYDNLCGLTGTAIGCESELSTVYERGVSEIPLCVPSARTLLPHRWFATQVARHHAIVQSVAEIHAGGRPILVGTRSIEDSKMIAAAMMACGLDAELLNGLQTAEEADIIARAGNTGSITIATNLAGRGTDIQLADDVRRLGGLHVVVAECQLSGRMDRQLIGRCGRQGDPGSAQAFVSAEDLLLTRFGSWLGATIGREADETGEAHCDLTAQLRRVQASAERRDFLSRCQLLRQDQQRDLLFGQSR